MKWRNRNMTDRKSIRLFVVATFLLTAIVANTCLQIEILNVQNDKYLPRTDFGNGNRKWRTAANSALLKSLEQQIAIERYTAFMAKHSDRPNMSPEQFFGPPYTAAEQELIDRSLARNSQESKLSSWVSSLGILQYVLAPLACFSAIVMFVVDRKPAIRIAAVVCSLLSVTSIYLMFYRGYFTSLGF